MSYPNITDYIWKPHQSFFIVSIVLLCVCLLVSTYTLFIYHCASYECKNFSRTEARISRGIANMLAKCACGLWEIEVPENTEKIAEHEGSFLNFTENPNHYQELWPWVRWLRTGNLWWKRKKTMGHFIKNSVLMNSNWDLNFMLTCWADFVFSSFVS